MSLFSKIGETLGISGSAQQGAAANESLRNIAANLRNFTPIRIRSGVGTTTLGPEGMSFAATDPAFAAAQGGVRNFFGNSVAALNKFNPATAEADTLATLRAQRATLFNPQLSSLESRLMQQGRLGLATGANDANPELQGFFAAQQDADLNAQLAAKNEARTQGSYLANQAGGAFNLMQETELPFGQGLFSLGQLILGNNTAAAGVEQAGVQAELAGKQAEQDARAGFWGGIIQAGIGLANPKPKLPRA